MAPRDSAVIHNKKYRDARQARMADGQQHCANFADEMQAAVGMVSDAFVRRIEFTKHRLPSIVLGCANFQAASKMTFRIERNHLAENSRENLYNISAAV